MHSMRVYYDRDTDPDLIKGAIRSLVSDRGYDRSQAFLRSLGPAATPFLKEAAAHDGSSGVRSASRTANGYRQLLMLISLTSSRSKRQFAPDRPGLRCHWTAEYSRSLRFYITGKSNVND